MPAIPVYRAFFEGRLRQVAIARDQLLRLCPEAASPGWEIRWEIAPIDVVEGVVIDWNKHGGSARCPKVHWQCPACNREHFSDFDQADSNPVLWFCEGGSGKLFLVRWSRERE